MNPIDRPELEWLAGAQWHVCAGCGCQRFTFEAAQPCPALPGGLHQWTMEGGPQRTAVQDAPPEGEAVNGDMGLALAPAMHSDLSGRLAEDLMRGMKGFTLVELMIVVVVIGILAAIGIPAYQSVIERAREAGVKSNMHTLEIAGEDFRAEHDGAIAATTAQIMGGASSGGPSGRVMWLGEQRVDFPNPFTGEHGEGGAWENRGGLDQLPSGTPGLVSWAAAGESWNIRGQGAHAALALTIGESDADSSGAAQ